MKTPAAAEGRNDYLSGLERHVRFAADAVSLRRETGADAWRAAGHKERPSFHGVSYDSMADDPATPIDEAHMFEPHFDRHVWIYRENPNGVFTPLNPAVSCANHRVTNAHVHGSH